MMWHNITLDLQLKVSDTLTTAPCHKKAITL